MIDGGALAELAEERHDDFTALNIQVYQTASKNVNKYGVTGPNVWARRTMNGNWDQVCCEKLYSSHTKQLEERSERFGVPTATIIIFIAISLRSCIAPLQSSARVGAVHVIVRG